MNQRVLGLGVGFLLLLCGATAWSEDQPINQQAEQWVRTLREPPSKDGKVQADVVAAARASLAGLDRGEAGPLVHRLLMSHRGAGRTEGIALVVKLKLEHLYAEVREAVHDRDNSVAIAALGALHQVTRGAAPLRHPLSARDDALARLDDRKLTEAALRALVKLNEFGDPAVVHRLARMSLASAFPPSKDEGLLEERGYIFVEMINSSSFRVRSLALRTLLDLISASPEHAKAMYGSAIQVEGCSADESSDVRYEAVRLLGFAAKTVPEHGNALVFYLEDRDPSVAKWAWYSVAQWRLAKTEVMASRLLYELENAEEAPARAAAAWLLRHAPASQASQVDAALSNVVKTTENNHLRRNAIASLLLRGVVPDSKHVVPTVVAWVERSRVTTPYPGGGRDMGPGWSPVEYPKFYPWGVGNAKMLKVLGPRAVAALEAKFQSAPKDQGARWIHALAYCGPEGMKAMDALPLEGQPQLSRALIQAQRTPPVEAAIDVLIEALQRTDEYWEGDPLQSAFARFGETALPKLLLAMSRVAPAETEEHPDWFHGAEYVIKEVGKPARAHLERAIVSYPDATAYFTDLLREIP